MEQWSPERVKYIKKLLDFGVSVDDVVLVVMRDFGATKKEALAQVQALRSAPASSSAQKPTARDPQTPPPAVDSAPKSLREQWTGQKTTEPPPPVDVGPKKASLRDHWMGMPDDDEGDDDKTAPGPSPSSGPSGGSQPAPSKKRSDLHTHVIEMGEELLESFIGQFGVIGGVVANRLRRNRGYFSGGPGGMGGPGGGAASEKMMSAVERGLSDVSRRIEDMGNRLTLALESAAESLRDSQRRASTEKPAVVKPSGIDSKNPLSPLSLLSRGALGAATMRIAASRAGMIAGGGVALGGVGLLAAGAMGLGGMMGGAKRPDAPAPEEDKLRARGEEDRAPPPEKAPSEITVRAREMTFKADVIEFKTKDGGTGGATRATRSPSPLEAPREPGAPPPDYDKRGNTSTPTSPSEVLSGPPGLLGKVGGWLGITPSEMGDGEKRPGVLGRLLGRGDGGTPNAGATREDAPSPQGGPGRGATGSWGSPDEGSSAPQGGAATLEDQRKTYMDQINSDPALKEKAMALMLSEEGGDSKGRMSVLETALNRSAAHGYKSLNDKGFDQRYYAPFQDGSYQKNLARVRSDPKLRARLEQEIDRVGKGSNFSNFGTQNGSGSVGESARHNQTPTARSDSGEQFSRKDVNPGMHGPKFVREEKSWYERTQAAMSQEARRKSMPTAEASTGAPSVTPQAPSFRGTGSSGSWDVVPTAPPSVKDEMNDAAAAKMQELSGMRRDQSTKPWPTTSGDDATPPTSEGGKDDEPPSTSRRDHFDHGDFGGLGLDHTNPYVGVGA